MDAEGEPDIAVPVRLRKKAKPPPNIITAGGVDMARGHASGIPIREGVSPEPSVDQPRVVVAVETDLRKLPTHKRIVIGRDLVADAARAAVPGHSTPVSTAAARPSRAEARHSGGTRPSREQQSSEAPPPEAKKLPVGMRLAFAAVLLLLLVGVAQRGRAPAVPVADTANDSLPPLPPPSPPTVAAVVEAPRPSAPELGDSAVEPPVPAPAPPRASVAVTPRPVRTPAPPAPPRATTFTPPFQLPSEKNRAGDSP